LARGRRTPKLKGRRNFQMATKRTTMRSSKGTKLYAVRNADGTFKDIQTYKRAHAADMRHKSAAERGAATKKTAAKKSAARKPAKKAVRKTARKAAKTARKR
jgi:hypothetical protein